MLDTAFFNQFFCQSFLFTGCNQPAHDIAAENVNNDIEIKVGPFGDTFQFGVSNLEESHLQVLSEPDVNLSAHPAPIVPVDVTKPAFQCGNNLG